MTQTAKRLITELQELPDAEQEAVAASYLEDLYQRREKEEREPYSFFKVLREAKLPGPRDASVTYEEKLYGSGVKEDG